MDKLVVFFKRYGFFLIIILILLFFSSGIYSFFNFVINPPMYIIVQFNDLGPLYKRMPVYYKGYKIGTTRKIEPSSDYKTTLVTICFYPRELKLPANTTVVVKKLDTGMDYISLEYPQKPSDEYLKNGSVIQGKTAMDIQSFMSAQAESGALGSIVGSAGQALASITKASDQVTVLINTLTKMVNENRPAIKLTTSSLAASAKNINQLTIKLNKSISTEQLNNITSNVESSTENINEITENVEEITENLNATVENIDATISQLNTASANINAITTGIKEQLCKKFAGIRIIFGQSVDKKHCPCKEHCSQN